MERVEEQMCLMVMYHKAVQYRSNIRISNLQEPFRGQDVRLAVSKDMIDRVAMRGVCTARKKPYMKGVSALMDWQPVTIGMCHRRS